MLSVCIVTPAAQEMQDLRAGAGVAEMEAVLDALRGN